MDFEEALKNLKLKFTSGNEFEVERATILRKEWDVIYPILEAELRKNKIEKIIKDRYDKLMSMEKEDLLKFIGIEK